MKYLIDSEKQQEKAPDPNDLFFESIAGTV
jgi:hypothetical protein